MKKRIFTSLCLFFISLPAGAFDSEEVTLDDSAMVNDIQESVVLPVKPSEIPKWEEFCESGYENAKLSEKQNILNVINFVDAERTKSNYWAERRLNFEKSIEHCNSLTEEKRSYCYEGVRKSETERNEMYEQQRKLMNYKNRGIVVDKPNY